MVNSVSIPNKVLILGGYSDIAVAICKELSALGCKKYIFAGRHENDFAINDVDVEFIYYDSLEYNTHKELIDLLFKDGEIDMVIYAVGIFMNTFNSVDAVNIGSTNYIGGMNSLLMICEKFKEQGYGRVVVMSSVAAIIPRKKNFIYGSSKAALDFFVRGLSLFYNDSGILFTIIRPGFVLTKMTDFIKKAPPLSSTPQEVAKNFIDKLTQEKKMNIIYVPSIMKFVVFILRLIPNYVMSKINI